MVERHSPYRLANLPLQWLFPPCLLLLSTANVRLFFKDVLGALNSILPTLEGNRNLLSSISHCLEADEETGSSLIRTVLGLTYFPEMSPTGGRGRGGEAKDTYEGFIILFCLLFL
jgi:hypothetical protein